MNILLLGDRQSEGTPLRDQLHALLAGAGHTIEAITLNREELAPCAGCFLCWLKSPGRCALTKDPANSVAEKLVRADGAVLLSRNTYGGFSADIKALIDRLIQNVLPYIERYKGQMHHVMRYKFFTTWVALGYGDASDAECRTFATLADRNALNIHPKAHIGLTVRNAEELAGQSAVILQTLEGARA